MIIRLSEIDDTLVVKGSMEAFRFMRVENNEFHIATPVTYALTVKKFDNLLTITGPCYFRSSLYLREVSGRIPAIDCHGYGHTDLLQTEIPQTSEFELKDEDMDVYYYKSDEIDLDPFVYEEVLLDMPIETLFARRIVRGSVAFAERIGTLKPVIAMQKSRYPSRRKTKIISKLIRSTQWLFRREKLQKQDVTRRRTHDKATPVTVVLCPNCKEPKLPHIVCPKCGMYNGKKYLEVGEE